MAAASIDGKGAKSESTDARVVRVERVKARRRRHAPAIVTAIAILALWQLIVTGFGVPTYIAPSPVQVLQVFVEQGDVLWINFWPTLLEAMAGFVLGNAIAVLLAVWFVHNQLAERAFYPIAVFINTIPIIAVAPILVLMLGNGYAPKIVIAALICFFPTLVNMVRGLKAVSPQMLELMRVLSASDREILWKIRLQSSLPFLFAALRIASTTCVIGAIVGEWIGSNYGLGWRSSIACTPRGCASIRRRPTATPRSARRKRSGAGGRSGGCSTSIPIRSPIPSSLPPPSTRMASNRRRSTW